MNSPPKNERGLCRTALQRLQVRQAYRLLSVLQAPFGFVFWKIEQLKGQIEGRLVKSGL
jgi:hypothetical protein